MQSKLLLHLLGVFVLFSGCGNGAAGDDSSNGEEPTKPVCRRIAKNSLSFCSMVDYVAVVDEDDQDGTTFDAKARFYYENVNVVLQRFGCHARYSLYTCDDCREAYKYWICSIKFQKCGQQPTPAATPEQEEAGGTDDSIEYHSAICSSNSVTSTTETCGNGALGRHRTCLSICEDVVRKCPYVLNFQCPTVSSSSSSPFAIATPFRSSSPLAPFSLLFENPKADTVFFSADIATCNKMDRTENPDHPDQPWPGTFADS